MILKKMISLIILISVMVGMYAVNVKKITNPRELEGKVKFPADKITCTKGICTFNFQGHQFEQNSDFSGLDLTNANFSGASLQNANFTGSILTNAQFTGAHLEGAVFKGADISNAQFAGTIADISGHKGNPATMPNQPQATTQAPMIVAMPATTTPSPMPAPTEQQVSTAPRVVQVSQPTPPVQPVAVPQSSSAPTRPSPTPVPGTPGGGIKN